MGGGLPRAHHRFRGVTSGREIPSAMGEGFRLTSRPDVPPRALSRRNDGERVAREPLVPGREKRWEVGPPLVPVSGIVDLDAITRIGGSLGDLEEHDLIAHPVRVTTAQRERDRALDTE